MKTCPVCDNAMPNGYCIYGCAIVHDRCSLRRKKLVATCKICDKEFPTVSDRHKYCSKKCRKVARAEQTKLYPKRKYEKYAKREKISDDSPEELLIAKEVNERESRYTHFHKIQCANCKYYFRTADPEKKHCSQECVKRSIHNEKLTKYRHAKEKMEAKPCKQCKVPYKTTLEDIGLCSVCRFEYNRVQKVQKELELQKQKPLEWAERKTADRRKLNRKINAKIEWAATEAKDTVSKRLKVMRG